MARIKEIWQTIHLPVLNNVKVYLLQHFVMDIIKNFGPKIEMVVRKYARSLPSYVATSEVDDLKTVAQLEFLETLKVWDSENHSTIWPLAQARMYGAMKDHIRYISKSDPSRYYDWVNEAAHMYKTVHTHADFEKKIETGDELNRAMKVLSLREKQIVIAHSRSEMTFKQIGSQVGVSESQVSRIYKKAIEKLKKELNVV